MRTRPILLSKICPRCGARARAEAKMPIPANLPTVEFDLDDLGELVRKQSLSHLLALVELLPYKTFACRKCGAEFRLESRSAKELVGALLTSMQPVLPKAKPEPAASLTKPAALPRERAKRPPPAPPRAPAPVPAPPPAQDWEAESLDALFDYSVDKKPPG
ncbi:MAG: hypothetical protein ACOZB0_11885 [Pseudomonadota bacterium]